MGFTKRVRNEQETGRIGRKFTKGVIADGITEGCYKGFSKGFLDRKQLK